MPLPGKTAIFLLPVAIFVWLYGLPPILCLPVFDKQPRLAQSLLMQLPSGPVNRSYVLSRNDPDAGRPQRYRVADAAAPGVSGCHGSISTRAL